MQVCLWNNLLLVFAGLLYGVCLFDLLWYCVATCGYLGLRFRLHCSYLRGYLFCFAIIGVGLVAAICFWILDGFCVTLFCEFVIWIACWFDCLYRVVWRDLWGKFSQGFVLVV